MELVGAVSSSVFQGAERPVAKRRIAGEWSDTRTAWETRTQWLSQRDRVKKGKQTESLQKQLDKYKAQAAKMHATGNSNVLTNGLNANLANWEKYAAEWNAVKKNKANST